MPTKIDEVFVTMRNWMFFLVAAWLTSTCDSRAYADGPSAQCTFYFAEQADLPEPVRQLMQQPEYTSVRTCRTLDGRSRSGALTLPTLVEPGVCVFRMDEWSTEHNPRLSGTFTFMSEGEGQACARQDDMSYVSAEGVSVGLFVQLSMFWRNLSMSKAQFRTMFVSQFDVEYSAELQRELEQLFFERQHRPALSAITFMPVYLPWRGYEMSTLLDADHSISIFVDLTPNGLRIFGVAESTQ